MGGREHANLASWWLQGLPPNLRWASVELENQEKRPCFQSRPDESQQTQRGQANQEWSFLVRKSWGAWQWQLRRRAWRVSSSPLIFQWHYGLWHRHKVQGWPFGLDLLRKRQPVKALDLVPRLVLQVVLYSQHFHRLLQTDDCASGNPSLAIRFHKHRTGPTDTLVV